MKKNLIVLLLIPFVIALLGVVTINTTHTFIENDIVGIKWNYNDVEVFEKDQEYLLVAEGINEKNYPAGKGNDLVWSISDTTMGEIVVKNGLSYFKPYVVGELVITFSLHSSTYRLEPLFSGITLISISNVALTFSLPFKSYSP